MKIATHPENDPQPTRLEKIKLIRQWTLLTLGQIIDLLDAKETYITGIPRETPACTGCGAIVVRAGDFYKCLNCGHIKEIQ